MTAVEFEARYVDLTAHQIRFLSPLNRSCTKTYGGALAREARLRSTMGK